MVLLTGVLEIYCFCVIFTSAILHHVKHKKKQANINNNSNREKHFDIQPISTFDEDDLLDILGSEKEIPDALPQPLDDLDTTAYKSTVSHSTQAEYNETTVPSTYIHLTTAHITPNMTTITSTTPIPSTTKTTIKQTTTTTPVQYITRRWFDVDGVPRYKQFDREELTANDVTRFHKIYRRQMSAFYLSARRYTYIYDLLQSYVNDTDIKQSIKSVNGDHYKGIDREVTNNDVNVKIDGSKDDVCSNWREFASRVEYVGSLYNRIQHNERLAFVQASYWKQLNEYADDLGIRNELQQVANSRGTKRNKVELLDYLRTILFPINLRQLYEFTQRQRLTPIAPMLTDVVNVTLRYTTNARYVLTFRKHLDSLMLSSYPPTHYYDIVKMKTCITLDELVTTPISYDALYVWIVLYKRLALSLEPRFDAIAFENKINHMIDRKTAARNMRRVFGKRAMQIDRDHLRTRFHSIVGLNATELLNTLY